MSIIEKAVRRLEELNRAGVRVPWDAAGLTALEAQAVSERGGPSARPHTLQSSPDSNREPALRASLGATQGHASSGIATALSAGAQSKRVVVDLAMLGDAGYLIPGLPRSALADDFRSIKRALLKNAHGGLTLPVRRSNLILITSAMQGEGKTFCAINLALSIASEVDSSVLLVDTDAVRPSLLSRMGIEGEHSGLLDLLSRDDLLLPDVMLRTNVPKLSVLPAGTPRANATELLASGAMERLLEELAQRYPDRIIVFDAPPLLLTTEAKVLATRMGQVLVVVAEDKSASKEVAQAFAALESVPVVMSVLNQARGRAADPQYGHY